MRGLNHKFRYINSYAYQFITNEFMQFGADVPDSQPWSQPLAAFAEPAQLQLYRSYIFTLLALQPGLHAGGVGKPRPRLCSPALPEAPFISASPAAPEMPLI